MGRVLKDAPLTTAKARARLQVGTHWRRLDAESHLGYRKGLGSSGWLVRWRNRHAGANYRQAPLGVANDLNDKVVAGVLNFDQACRIARSRVDAERAKGAAEASGPPLTVRSAVEDYIIERDARDTRRKGRPVRSDAHSRLRRHVIGVETRGRRAAIEPVPLSFCSFSELTEADLVAWRKGLSEGLSASTRQRLFNDLRAAINAAYAKNRHRIGPALPGILKHGLSEGVGPDDLLIVARENQILTDAQLSLLLSAARDVDSEQSWDGDLYRLVIVLAATGARFSQVARMKVDDCQRERGRLIIPASRKGRGKAGTIAVPVGADVLDALREVSLARPRDAPLLERWRHEQIAGDERRSFEWSRAGRSPWSAAAELSRPWQAIREQAGLPDVVPYALRHTSIVRGIRANLPLRLVAALHDTSTAMIERHYARWIVDGLEELAARAVIPLIPSSSGEN